MDIASDYATAVTEDCAMSGLLSPLTYDQQTAWFAYIINYTSALFECEFVFDDPLPGGVDAFGPANTGAVGVPSPVLAPDEAARLIHTYLMFCAEYIALQPEELTDLRSHLERAAEQQIDSEVSSRLSECPPEPAAP